MPGPPVGKSESRSDCLHLSGQSQGSAQMWPDVLHLPVVSGHLVCSCKTAWSRHRVCCHCPVMCTSSSSVPDRLRLEASPNSPVAASVSQSILSPGTMQQQCSKGEINLLVVLLRRLQLHYSNMSINQTSRRQLPGVPCTKP